MGNQVLFELVSLGRDIFGGGTGNDFFAEALEGQREWRFVTPDQPRLEEGGSHGGVRCRQFDEIGDRADRMADLDLKVPQKVENILDALLQRFVWLPAS